MTNYAKKHPYILTSGLITIGLIFLWIQGYRLQPNFSIAKNGSIEAVIPLINTTIFVDNTEVLTTTEENQTVRIPLRAKEHSIIIGRDGYFPWAKTVFVPAATTTKIQPMFVTQNATGQIVTQNDSQYWSLRGQIQNTIVPTRENPLTEGTTSLWVENNTVYTKDLVTEKTISIITPVDTIRGVSFYKDRTDVIVFASDNGVYALEALENAANNNANFFPVYKGVSPIFQKTDPSFLYVLDGENLMMVVI